MRSLAAVMILVGCTNARQLANPADPRLHVSDQSSGFVVRTTERWHERIDPNTSLWFRNRSGQWTDTISARSLRVDREGAWVEQFVKPIQVVDAVRIVGLSERAAAQIAATRPEQGAVVERDGDAWVLSANRKELHAWLLALELAIAKLEPLDHVAVCDSPCYPGGPTHQVDGDDAKLYQLDITDNSSPLGTWAFSSAGGGWQAPLRGPALINFLHDGRTLKVGWRWTDIAEVRVENVSGAKTFAAIGVGILTIPIHNDSREVDAMMPVAPKAEWEPSMVPDSSLGAHHLFTTGARVRSIIRPLVTMDAVSSIHRDYMASGISARIRLGDIFEIGGGAREALARTMSGWQRDTTGMFQMGVHIPLDAALHYAIPFGFEAGAGGHVSSDVRFPWGLRYTTGRWLATVTPATPQYLHIDGEPRRWSLASGVELGASF